MGLVGKKETAGRLWACFCIRMWQCTVLRTNSWLISGKLIAAKGKMGNFIGDMMLAKAGVTSFFVAPAQLIGTEVVN